MAVQSVAAPSSEELKRWSNDPDQARLNLRRILVGITDEDLCDWATEALENLGAPLPHDLDFLIGQLSDPSNDVSYWACTLIGRLNQPASKAATHLQALVELPSTPPKIQQRAIWALQKITNGQEAQ